MSCAQLRSTSGSRPFQQRVLPGSSRYLAVHGLPLPNLAQAPFRFLNADIWLREDQVDDLKVPPTPAHDA